MSWQLIATDEELALFDAAAMGLLPFRILPHGEGWLIRVAWSSAVANDPLMHGVCFRCETLDQLAEVISHTAKFWTERRDLNMARAAEQRRRALSLTSRGRTPTPPIGDVLENLDIKLDF